MNLNFTASTLIASLLVSSVGFGIFLYGKKERRGPQLLGGLALMAFPYFVASAWLMFTIAAAVIGGVWLAVRAGW